MTESTRTPFQLYVLLSKMNGEYIVWLEMFRPLHHHHGLIPRFLVSVSPLSLFSEISCCDMVFFAVAQTNGSRLLFLI